MMDMRIPNLANWKPTDFRWDAVTKEMKQRDQDKLLAQIRQIAHMKQGGRMTAEAIRKATGTHDKHMACYLRRLSDEGVLKRESVRSAFVYSLAKEAKTIEEKRKRKEKIARLELLRDRAVLDIQNKRFALQGVRGAELLMRRAQTILECEQRLRGLR